MLNFWFPLTARREQIMTTIIWFILTFVYSSVAVSAQQKEDHFLESGKLLFNPSFISGSSWIRLFWLIPVLFDIFYFYIQIHIPRGYLFFKIIDNSFGLEWLCYSYFMAVTPMPPGKSKIKEWLESFATGFKKLTPIPTTNK